MTQPGDINTRPVTAAPLSLSSVEQNSSFVIFQSDNFSSAAPREQLCCAPAWARALVPDDRRLISVKVSETFLNVHVQC